MPEQKAPAVNQASRVVRTKVDRFYASQLVKAGTTFTVAKGEYDPKTMEEVPPATRDELAHNLRPRPTPPGLAPNTRRGVQDADNARPSVIPAAPAAGFVAEDTDLSRPNVTPAAPAKSVL